MTATAEFVLYVRRDVFLLAIFILIVGEVMSLCSNRRANTIQSIGASLFFGALWSAMMVLFHSMSVSVEQLIGRIAGSGIATIVAAALACQRYRVNLYGRAFAGFVAGFSFTSVVSYMALLVLVAISK